MVGVQKKLLHNYQAVTKFPEPVEKWRDFHFIVESVISVQILGPLDTSRVSTIRLLHSRWVDTFAQPTSKGISPFLLICQMEKSSHLYRTLFLASLSIL